MRQREEERERQQVERGALGNFADSSPRAQGRLLIEGWLENAAAPAG
jgi:hypothetical protein